jgi:hypothetical protein
MIPSSSPAAGHSGQNSTARRSEIKLSKIARYSASLLDFVIFVFPDLGGEESRKATRMTLDRGVPLCEEKDNGLGRLYGRLQPVGVEIHFLVTGG